MSVTIGPGFVIGSGFAISSDSFSISFVTSATVQFSAVNGTSTSITLPSTIQANDIIVVWFTSGDSNSATSPTQTTPTGYTLINSATASNTAAADAERANLYYKIAVAGDAGSTLTITSSTADYRIICLGVYRTTKSSAPIVTNSSINSYGVTTASGTPVTPPNQTVTSGTRTLPLIVFASYLGAATRTFTPTQDGDITPSAGRVLSYKIYNSPPADVTVGSTPSSTTIIMQSFYMALS